MKVSVVGTGYVGLTTGASLAFLGHQVTCIDLDPHKIEMLRAGRSPIFEPFLEDLLAAASANLTFTTEYAEGVPEADVVFVAVQTPSLPDGNPDLRFLRSAAESVGQHISSGHDSRGDDSRGGDSRGDDSRGDAADHYTVVVNKSTVPIGSGNWVDAILRDAYEERHGSSADGRLGVASNPEFLREGAAIGDTLYPDRIVIGSDDVRSLEVLTRLYRTVLDQSFTAPAFLPRPDDLGAVPLVSTDLASAELIKYAANAFLALKISYINEIGYLAGKVGADITKVARGTGLDSRIGPRFLQPGVGWGGSCFGKDTAALISTAAEYNYDMPIVRAARDVNERQRGAVVDRLLDELRIIKGRRIGVLGLAFKPNTDDLRDAPAIDITRTLIARGARPRLHDPVAAERFRREQPDLAEYLCDSAEDVFDGVDALILVTEWSQYLELDWAKLMGTMRTPLVLDGRYALDRGRLEKLGYRYLSMTD